MWVEETEGNSDNGSKRRIDKMNMYVVAIIWSLVFAFAIGKVSQKGSDRNGKENKKKSNGFHYREGWIGYGNIGIPSRLLMGSIIVSLIWVFIFGDLLFGTYIDSGYAFGWILFPSLIIGGGSHIYYNKILSGPVNIERWGWLKIAIAIVLFLVLLFVPLNTVLNPSGIDNPMFDQLNENNYKGEALEYVIDPLEIRVISWDLAGKFLERGYSEHASQFDITRAALDEYTNPTIVNGRFIWVNAPEYEFLKWTGGKKIPFYLYVENDAYNMTIGESEVEHRVDTPFSVHDERIEWENRIEQVCFDRYGLEYAIDQVRMDVDDDWNPYWVVYLCRIDFWYGKSHLEKLLIIDATEINSFKEYNIDSSNIPDWLEVVYNDYYVYDWVEYWGNERFGLGYKWFNKQHMFEPDDVGARFVVMNGTSYWQIPMKQRESSVLGGFVRVNTRTGKTYFYNREESSYVDMGTAKEQVTKYLSSGAEGYRQLDLDEGYLYSFKMNDNSIREAYVFPLYAGFTINRFAIVDAIKYTTDPVLETTIEGAMEQYTARIYEGINVSDISLQWERGDIENGFMDTNENYAAITLTINGSEKTYVVYEDDLATGMILRPNDEWNELLLALSEYNRGSNVALWIVKNGNTIIDVDWEDATLVER